MNHQSLKVVTAFFLFCVAAASLLTPISTRQQRRVIAKSIVNELPTITIASPEEFASAFQADFLLLHIDVDWSDSARQSRSQIAQLRSAMELSEDLPQPIFRRIDCTEQEGPVYEALRQWLSKNDSDDLQLHGAEFGGAGTLIWVRAGEAVDVARFPAGDTIDALVAKTRTAMAMKK